MEMNYEEGASQGNKTLWIIGGIIVVIMIIGLVYGATQRSLKTTDQNTDDDALVVLDPVTGNRLPSSGNNTPGVPALADSEKVVLPVEITSLDVVNLETFPNQVQARIAYGLSGDCAVLDTPTVSLVGTVYTVTMTSYAPKDAVCTKNIVPGERVVVIPVEGVRAGTYSVKVGSKTKTFTLQTDNKVQFSGDK